METIIYTFNNAIGWSILHSLWQGACIYLIVFGLFLVFPSMNSTQKYRTAFLGQSLLFTSFIFTFYTYLSFQSFKPTDIAMGEQEELLLYVTYLQSNTWTITQLFPYLVTLYSVGIILQISIFCKSIRKLNKIKVSSSLGIPDQWSMALDKAISKTKISSKVQLLLSQHITSPITIGFLKPLIVFPTAYIHNISKEEAEEILLHELAHIKQYDYVFNILLIVMETILFFNPFVWLMSKHIKLEREQRCDDFVSAHTGDPLSYSKTLLKVELLRQENEVSLALAAVGHNKYNLLNRIKRINNRTMATKYTSVKHQLVALLLTTVTLITVAWTNPKVEIEENTPLSITSASASLAANTMLDTSRTLTANQKKVLEIIENKEIKELTKEIDGKAINLKEYTESTTNKKHIINLEKINKDMQIYFDSPEWKNRVITIETNAKNTEEYFNSAAWKAQIAEIEENARKIEAKYNSPEYKEYIAKIEQNARRIEARYNSPEYKEHIAKIEENARRVEARYNSPEYKEHIAKIEENARRVEARYNSPEYKEHIAKIEENARRVEARYNSPEYKERIAKIEENARRVEARYNSPEYKERIAKIEENARKIEERFNSPERKGKMIIIEELNNSTLPINIKINYSEDLQKVKNK